MIFYFIKNMAYLYVKVFPSSKFNSFDGFGFDVKGRRYLKIKISKIAEGGEANHELIRFCAKQFKVIQSNVLILNGHSSRLKMIEILGYEQSALEDLVNEIFKVT